MIFVQLDCDYDADERLVDAGPYAELLYVRGLAFAKRTLTDGHISRGQLSIVGHGIPRVAAHAKRLVESGAWTETERGFHIVAWSKRNLSAAEITERQNNRSVKMNHVRWHTGANGTPSPECPLCVRVSAMTDGPQGNVKESYKESSKESIGSPIVIDRAIDTYIAIDKESSSRVQEETAHAATTTLDQRVADAIELHARTSAEGKERPGAYAATVRNNTMIEHGASLAAYCIEHPDSGSLEIVQAVLGTNPHPEARPTREAWYADPHCEHGCDGTGLLKVGEDNDRYLAPLGPCPCRRPEPWLATVTDIRQATA